MIFQKKYTINKEHSELINILTDISRYAHFHPVIISAEKIENLDNGNTKYLILEKPYHYIPKKVKYYAEVITSKNTIEYKITGIPFTKVKITYNLDWLNDEPSILIFNLDIKGINIIKSMLSKLMIQSQDILIGNINQAFAKTKTTQL